MGDKTDRKNKAAGLLDRLNEIPSIISGVAIVAVIVFIIINILLRRIFSAPISGFYDITGVIGIIIFSFAIVYAAIKGSHVSVRILTSRLPKRVQDKVTIFQRIIVVITSVLIAYASFNRAINPLLNNDVSTDIKIPTNPFRVLLVVAFIILVIVVLSGKDISKGGDE